MLLAGIVALMWVIEAINSIDGQGLDSDGIYPRNVDHLWGVVTAPFLHVSFTHLIDNTIPFVFMGVIIALRGAARLALVTAIVILIGGLGTWLIAPAGSVTVGASGVVFGYATYLFARGLFDRSPLESPDRSRRRRGLGRGTALEPRAPVRDLVAGARVRRDRRRGGSSDARAATDPPVGPGKSHPGYAPDRPLADSGQRHGRTAGQPALATLRRVRIFSGIQPTGRKHLGNYIGAITQYVAGQDRGEAIYCVVDLHAHRPWPTSPPVCASRSMTAAATLLAAGLDPERCIFFRQSDVPEHSELNWLLSSVTSFGELSRMTQFKDKAGDQRDLVTAGLFTYPVLMAADVLAYRAHEVPGR